MDVDASIGRATGRRHVLQLALLSGAVALGLNCSVPGHAAAASDLFLNWPGVPGDSLAKGFVGQIELSSYSQTASNTASSNPNAPAKGICGQITVTKQLDHASPILLGQILQETQTSGPVTISFVKTGQATSYTFYSVALHNVVPVSITQSDNLSGDVIETLVFMATQFVFSFTPQNLNGTPGTTLSFGFDCKTNRKI